MGVRRDLRRGAYAERGRHRQHRERHLHDEDRLPRERLGEQAARERAGRRTDDSGRHPRRDAPALAALGDQQLQAPDQRERATERLHAPGHDQRLDRRRDRTPRRGAGEHRDADSREDPRLRPGEAHRGGHGTQPQHEVERDQHPGDLPDRGIEVPEDVGQRERDHRGVREHERDGHGEQRSHGATHPAILASRLHSLAEPSGGIHHDLDHQWVDADGDGAPRVRVEPR